MIVRPTGRSNTKNIYIAVFIFLVVTVAFVFLLLRPSLAQLHSLRNTTVDQQSNLQELLNLQQRYNTTLAAYNTAVNNAHELYSCFPREADLPRILSVMANLTRNHGVITQRLDYSQPKWKDGLGNLQIDAKFIGNYTQLAKVIIQLPIILPSAHIDNVQITAVLHNDVNYKKEAASDSDLAIGSAFPGLSSVPIARAITGALGLNTPVTSTTISRDASLSPLEVDHLEAQVIITIWLLEEDATTIDDTPVAGWYARQPETIDLPANDPFQPSVTARRLVEGRAIAEKLAQTKLTGIVHSGQRTLAYLEVDGQSLLVGEGDTISELANAKVISIQSEHKRIIMEIIGGERIPIYMGGELK